MADILLTAWGNASRGDDALGPLLLQRLQAWASSLDMAERFAWVEDFQLQVEHALELEGKSLALYIDAGEGTQAPFSFSLLRPLSKAWHTTHAMPPESVLAVFEQVSYKPPCPAFLLCISGKDFLLHEGLSAEAETHLEAAFSFAQTLLQNPRAEAWHAAALARVDERK